MQDTPRSISLLLLLLLLLKRENKIKFKTLYKNSMLRVVHPRTGSGSRFFSPFRIRMTDPGIEKAPDPESGSATL